MNPVSTRGRSMPRDRRMCRALLVMLGILGSSLATGCLRSPLLRPADGPMPQSGPLKDPLPPSEPATSSVPTPQVKADSGDKAVFPSTPAVIPSPAASSAATAPLELQAAPTPLQVQAADVPMPSPQPQSATPVAAPPAGQAPETQTTPLLDAAIERVTAIREQQRDLPDPEVSPARRDQTPPSPIARISPAVAPAPPPLKKPDPGPAADTTGSLPPVAPTLIQHEDLLPRSARASRSQTRRAPDASRPSLKTGRRS